MYPRRDCAAVPAAGGPRLSRPHLLVDGNYAAAQPSRAGCVRLVGADVLGRPPPATAPLTIDVRRGRGYNNCASDVAFKLT